MKLTKKSIDAIKPDGADRIYWDDELRGFGLRLKQSGLGSGFVNWKYQVAINTTAGGCGCIRTRGDKAATGSLLPESVRWPVIVEGLAFDGDLHFVLRDLEQAHPNDER